MKKAITTLALAALAISFSLAQKFAFVDTDYVLNNIPSYKAAENELDKLSKQYENEVSAMFENIDKMYREYQAEKVLLTDEIKSKREEEIITKEREAKKLQNDYFGQEGLLFKKRQELIKPIQDEVYGAVKEIANENGYAVIFDSASGPTMLYTNPRYDISDEVLQRLGYKN
ncbi:MAG: OmpH family outer membrane protein [Bacteroidales bacterium]|nr:OmpH family outer membrane protein [Bacteroidales bacterium]